MNCFREQIIALLLLTSLFISVNGESISKRNASSAFNFIGTEHWSHEHMELCETLGKLNESLYCYTHIHNYQRLNVEVLSEDPILIIFREFASAEMVAGLLTDLNEVQLVPTQVVNRDVEDFQTKNDTGRRANGTFLHHEHSDKFAQMFRRAKAMLPFVNFGSAENWQILSYHPGGHYAPHYDYLTFKSTAQWDSWTKMLKNRFATFLLSLQRAAKGGGTVFPHLDVTVMPSPGDVVFWTNMDAHEDLANKTLHGACVVKEGVKIATTLWIRAKDQDMLLSPLHDGRFDINKLVHPNLAFFGMTPATQL